MKCEPGLLRTRRSRSQRLRRWKIENSPCDSRSSGAKTIRPKPPADFERVSIRRNFKYRITQGLTWGAHSCAHRSRSRNLSRRISRRRRTPCMRIRVDERPQLCGNDRLACIEPQLLTDRPTGATGQHTGCKIVSDTRAHYAGKLVCWNTRSFVRVRSRKPRRK